MQCGKKLLESVLLINEAVHAANCVTSTQGFSHPMQTVSRGQTLQNSTSNLKNTCATILEEKEYIITKYISPCRKNE